MTFMELQPSEQVKVEYMLQLFTLLKLRDSIYQKIKTIRKQHPLILELPETEDNNFSDQTDEDEDAVDVLQRQKHKTKAPAWMRDSVEYLVECNYVILISISHLFMNFLLLFYVIIYHIHCLLYYYIYTSS